jgi:hypothetical protein
MHYYMLCSGAAAALSVAVKLSAAAAAAAKDDARSLTKNDYTRSLAWAAEIWLLPLQLRHR